VSFTLPELKSKLIDDPPIATSVVPTFVIDPVVFGCHCFDDCRVDSLLSASIDVESVEKSGIILKPSMSMAVSSECDGSCMPLDRYWIPSRGEVLDHGANQQEGAFQTPASKANDGTALSNNGGPASAIEEAVRYDLLICNVSFPYTHKPLLSQI
jgi:hypothetical protein